MPKNTEQKKILIVEDDFNFGKIDTTVTEEMADLVSIV